MLVRHPDETVLDLGVCAPLPRAELVDHRIRRVLLGQPSGLAVERGREEQRLAVPRAGADDPVDRGAEAHVEHPVGLIEDQGLDPVQSERAASEEILQPARSRDQHVGGRGGLGLLDQPGAAVDGGDAQRTGVRDAADVVDDLRAPARGLAPARAPPAAGRWPRSARRAGSRTRASCRSRSATWRSRHGRRSRRRSRKLWIANGRVMPASESELMTACETPRSANDSIDIRNSLAAHVGR